MPVLVVGTGKSLEGFDFNRLRGLGHILAVKNSVWDLPFADACFGLDLPWMVRDKPRLRELAKRMPLYLAVPDGDPPSAQSDVLGIDDAIYLKRDQQCGPLSLVPDTIEAGANSGFGGFNLAVLKKPKQIVLFGYDYSGGDDHYNHDQYRRPVGALAHSARYWPRWAKNFGPSVPILKRLGVEVLNASPKSLVDAFPKVTLEQAIQHLDRLRSERSSSVCGSVGVGVEKHHAEGGADPRGSAVPA